MHDWGCEGPSCTADLGWNHVLSLEPTGRAAGTLPPGHRGPKKCENIPSDDQGCLRYGNQKPSDKQVHSRLLGGHSNGMELSCLHSDDGRSLLREG
ncbi:hypothetical protein AVEN_269654-1 [Araneus ventricosus]|uniref:Uncharacterized protein n=1 Tax=Araneus ventricosus TaxID=182803 RepID=A0A4Y2CSK5_ARAVE|nr:hypothetical protein AVEN_269654-1 [Araneus ventricosus]